ncbi:YDG/SRA domain-containing protein [Pedococcus sp. 5OH_020]|uniref:YDG/SRA domain-containing protein n=1 Tax=Pedococcus sp. 5OH_020 TaxID=2989814 RepID=UPI0022E9B14F|nr:YDG/SRA domain-containing protein [Pedococcus sp. 5OH_020]
MADYYFGEIQGNPVGTTYASRQEAAAAGVHRVTVQGISGNRIAGAESISVNGGYEDDEDLGDEIIYTGAGGNDPATGRQIADQTLSQAGNAGMVVSEENGYPIRVMRGSNGDPKYSPVSGYRYDGLYRVDDHWAEAGKSGYRIWRFRLIRLTLREAAAYVPIANLPVGNVRPGRTEGVAQRIVRSTQVSDSVKKLYEHACQVCDVQLRLPVGMYSEGAHIRGLGKPHDGPDTPDNVLCLCPNHHAQFDLGGIYIDAQFRVRDHTGATLGPLYRKSGHMVNQDHLSYHRTRFGHDLDEP